MYNKRNKKNVVKSLKLVGKEILKQLFIKAIQSLPDLINFLTDFF